MKLCKLDIEGFMGFRGKHVLGLQERGLVHIAGQNEDDPANNSNGSGKTTILEALTWGLFGEGLPRPKGDAAQGVRADEVLNDQTKKQCLVRVELEDEEGSYLVERWRKWKGPEDKRQSNGVRLTVDGEMQGTHEVEALDEKETNRLICQQLGMDRDIWCRGVVFGQESAFNFCEATSKKRTEILTTVMGLEELDGWHERCRDEKRALTNKMAESGGKIEIQKAHLERLAQEDPQAKVDQWEVERTERVRGLEAGREAIVAAGKSLKERLAQAVIPEIPPPLTFPVPAELQEEHDQAQRHLRELELVEYSAKNALQKAQETISQLESKKSTVCPTCGQRLPEPAARGSCLIQARRELAEARGTLDGLAPRLYEAKAAEGAARAKVTAATLKGRTVAEEHQKAQAAREQALAQKADLERQIEVQREKWRHHITYLDRLRVEENPHRGEVHSWAAKCSELTVGLNELEDAQAEIGLALDVCLWWDKELPRFRTWMFDSIVDTLAAEANRWLKVMSAGVIWIQITTQVARGKRLKDELDVQVYRWQPDGTIISRPYRVWSGGEKRRIGLAVDFGLSRLLADRAAKAYRFLGIDEIDRHLDEQGREGLRQVLEELRQERETCLVVTHDPQFRASFDTEVLVTKTKGQSRLEVRDVR